MMIIDESEILYSFKGKFNFQLVDVFLMDIKQYLANSKIDRKTARKTYKILVECLENSCKHNTFVTNGEQYTHSSLFTLTSNNIGFKIFVGNALINSDLLKLTGQIDLINASSLIELKKLRRTRLLNSDLSKKGGAGIGLIDIALSSKNKLAYSIRTLDGNKSFFSMEIEINSIS